MEIVSYPSRAEWSTLVQRPALDVTTLFDTVRSVLERVRQEGDAAVKAYEKQFDKVELDQLQVSEDELSEAAQLVSAELKMAIQTAKIHIERFHAAQRFAGVEVETTPGVRCWQQARTKERVVR